MNDKGGKREHQGRESSWVGGELNDLGLVRKMNLGRDTDFIASKESIKDKTRVRQLVTRKGVGLGNATGVWVASLAEVRIYDIVAGTIGRAPGVFVAHVGERWVGQVILFTCGLIG